MPKCNVDNISLNPGQDEKNDKIFSNSLGTSIYEVQQQVRQLSLPYLKNNPELEKHFKVIDGLFADIMIPAAKQINDVTIDSKRTKGVAKGIAQRALYNAQNRSIRLYTRKTAPHTYAEKSPYEILAEEMMHMFLWLPMRRDIDFRNAMIKAFNLVKKNVGHDTFLRKENGEIIYLTDKTAEIKLAEANYKNIFDPTRLSDESLQEFVAGVLTNPHLAEAARKTKIPHESIRSKYRDVSGNTVLDFIYGLVSRIFGFIKDLINNEIRRGTQNAYDTVYDYVAQIIAANERKREQINYLESMESVGMLQKADVITSNKLHELFKSLVNKYITEWNAPLGARSFRQPTNLIDYVVILGTLHSNDMGKILAQNPDFMRNTYSALFDFLKEYRLPTELYKIYHAMFGRDSLELINHLYGVRKGVDQTRKRFSDVAAETLQYSFAEPDAISHIQREALGTFFIFTDAPALLSLDGMTENKVIDLMFNPNDRDILKKEIISKLGIAPFEFLDRQARGLAQLMVYGETRYANTFTNIDAIIINHPQQPVPKFNKKKKKFAKDLDLYDAYVTLLALDLVDESVFNLLKPLLETERTNSYSRNGFTHILTTLKGIKDRVLQVDYMGNRFAMSKVYYQPLKDPFVTAKIATREQGQEFLETGYTHHYDLVPLYGSKKKYGVYVHTLAPATERVQGLFSLTQDPTMGLSLRTLLSKEIDEPQMVSRLIQAFAKKEKEANKKQIGQTTASDPVRWVPVVNDRGYIVDYTMPFNHAFAREVLKNSVSIFDLIPKMVMRTVDLENTRTYNKTLIKILDKIRADKYETEPWLFIDVLDEKYRADLFYRLPYTTRQRIRDLAWTEIDEKTGEEKEVFQVEFLNLDLLFGYDQPTAANLPWLRGNPKLRHYIRIAEAVVGELGGKGRSIMAMLPGTLQRNMVSNAVTARMFGVPIEYMAEQSRAAITALREYEKLAAQHTRIYYKIHIAKDPAYLDSNRKPNVRAATQLERAARTMEMSPIHPLIDRGLLGIFSESEVIHGSSIRGRIHKKVEGIMSDTLRSSPKLIEAVRQGWMVEGTTVQKTLTHIMRVTDFVNRYAIHKYFLEERGWEQEAVDRLIDEIFVNYNVPIPKSLAYADKMNLVMFIRYYLGIQKVNLQLLRDHPVTSLGVVLANGAGVPIPTTLDTSMFMLNAPHALRMFNALEFAAFPLYHLGKDIKGYLDD